MTEALDAMVKAMGAALKAQEVVNGSANFASETGDGAEWRIDGYFDLEKVARAGLEAIREPTDLIGLGIGRLDGYRPGSHSPHAIWVAMMAEVLKDAAP